MEKIYEDNLKILANEDIKLAAIEAVFSEEIEKSKPIITMGMGDEIIGQEYRSYIAAQLLIKKALDTIRNYKEVKQDNQIFDKSK